VGSGGERERRSSMEFPQRGAFPAKASAKSSPLLSSSSPPLLAVF
jgi:hypothetical protein